MKSSTYNLNKISFVKGLTLFLFIFLAHSNSQSTPLGITLQGTLTNPSSLPVEEGAVYFQLMVRSPGVENCVLYEESHTINMTNSKGAFSLVLGAGLRSGTNFKDTSTLLQVFNNSSSTISSLNCTSGTTYTPTSTDSRKISIVFDDGTAAGPQTLTQLLSIQSVPYALYAESLQGKIPSDFTQNIDGTTQTKFQTVFDTRYAALDALLNGTSTLYTGASGANFTPTSSVNFNSQSITNLAAPTNPGDAVNKTYSDSYVGGKNADTATLSGLGAGDSGKVLSWNGTQWTASPSSSQWTTTGSDIYYNTGNIGMGTVTPNEKLEVNGNLRFSSGANRTLTVTPVTGVNGNSLTINAGNTNSPSTGGSLFLNAGTGANTTGSTVQLGGGGYNGGTVLIRAGRPDTNGVSGSVQIKGGDSGGNTAGGNISIFGGAGGNGGGGQNGGNIYVAGGSPGTGGNEGNLILGHTGSVARGKVGIGLTNPSVPLDVSGKVKTSGDIQVGNSSLTCDATTKGSIRYNDGTSSMEFCNGSVWGLLQAGTCSDPIVDAFNFTNQANAALSTVVLSDIKQVNGINCVVSLGVSGPGSPEMQVCSDAGCTSVIQGWTSGASSIQSGQYIQLRQTTDAVGGSTYGTTLNVGAYSTTWNVTTLGDCASSPAVGTVCADGTVYVGLSPDGNVPMYTTRCSYGQTWDGSACTGTITAVNWNNGSGTAVSSGAISSTGGSSNTSTLILAANAHVPYAAAVICDSLNENGHTDWYLPAPAELSVVYDARSVVDISTNGFWTSKENSSSMTNYISFSTGTLSAANKNSLLAVRCVRK